MLYTTQACLLSIYYGPLIFCITLEEVPAKPLSMHCKANFWYISFVKFPNLHDPYYSVLIMCNDLYIICADL